MHQAQGWRKGVILPCSLRPTKTHREGHHLSHCHLPSVLLLKEWPLNQQPGHRWEPYLAPLRHPGSESVPGCPGNLCACSSLRSFSSHIPASLSQALEARRWEGEFPPSAYEHSLLSRLMRPPASSQLESVDPAGTLRGHFAALFTITWLSGPWPETA